MSPAGAHPGRYRSVLRQRDARLLFGGLIVSSTGSWAYNVALLAFVFERTHSLGWVAAAGLGRFVPALLFSAYGGVVAERFERVRLMLCSDLLCLTWQVLLALVVALDGPVVLAIALAGLTAVSAIVYAPAVEAMLPQIAAEDDLAAANALNATIENLTVVSGPAIGAALVAVASPALAFGVNAATFAVSAVLVGSMKVRSRPVDVTEAGDAGPLAQMMAGVRAINSNATARLLVGFSVLASFVYGSDTALLVSVADVKLGLGADGYGLLLAGEGVGGVLAALVVNRIAASPRLGTIILAGMAVYCLPTALLTVVHAPGIAIPLQLLRGAGTLVVDVMAVTALQRAVPGELLARVFGVFFAYVLVAISIGTVIVPPLVSLAGIDATLLIMGFGPPLAGLLALPALRRMDRENAQRTAALAPRVAVLERLGIFAAAGRPALERLARAASELTAGPGTAIVREGDPADALYVLVAGSVDVTARGEAGAEERPLRTMPAGSYFGEIGLLESIPRTATVTAAEPCRLLRIDGDAFLDALMAAPMTGTLVEDARMRLARTHPSRRLTYAASGPAGDAGGGAA
jgi:predicted MFS family arabinose efflux permease